MHGTWIFIEKNGRRIWAYKRLDVALRRFDIVCSRSIKYVDRVRMVDEVGRVLREF